MDGLDFSELDDDQLLNLIRAALREAADRHPGVAAAAKAAMLDEQERMRIITEVSEREAAALRAKERERVAAEAAAKVREEHAAKERAATAARAAEVGKEAREKAAAQQARQISWLNRASKLVGVPPNEITIVYIASQYGPRVLVNHGGRYEREHLSDWNKDTGTVKTPQRLVKTKPDLAAFSAEFVAAINNRTGVALIGSDICP